jgi:hypothetical protein
LLDEEAMGLAVFGDPQEAAVLDRDNGGVAIDQFAPIGDHFVTGLENAQFDLGLLCLAVLAMRVAGEVQGIPGESISQPIPGCRMALTGEWIR